MKSEEQIRSKIAEAERYIKERLEDHEWSPDRIMILELLNTSRSSLLWVLSDKDRIEKDELTKKVDWEITCHEASEIFFNLKRKKMISQREVEKRYSKLLKDVETNDYYKIDLTNRVNCYVCECGHVTKTKDIDPGVTPFFHRCERCGIPAKSTFYKDIIPDQPPTEEWYRPTLKEAFKMRKNPEMLDHVLSGGLVIRKIIQN